MAPLRQGSDSHSSISVSQLTPGDDDHDDDDDSSDTRCHINLSTIK